MSRVIPKDIRMEAHRRVSAVLRCLAVLVPDATPRRRRKIANRVLSMCDGVDRCVRISQDQARFLILPHMQCLLGNESKCPEVVAWEPIARSLNMFFEDE